MKFHLQSAAKINLSLDILSRRADGYHELASVVHTVGIWDTIEIELNQNGAITFGCNISELQGDDNLCVRAVGKWNHVTGENFGAQIHLHKHIPTGAGLGGGSGNAAAILLALNQATKTPLSEEKLKATGAELGADVPLFLQGGAVLMEGIGEKLTPLAPKSGWLVIVKPQQSFSTPEIYRLWDEQKRFSNRATPQMLENWHRASLNRLAQDLGNDLQLPAQSVSTLPRICIQLLREVGALGAQMSGSGSACFGIFESETLAREAEKKLNLELAKLVLLNSAQVFVAPFCESGAQIARR